jgi:hypothetical protein
VKLQGAGDHYWYTWLGELDRAMSAIYKIGLSVAALIVGIVVFSKSDTQVREEGEKARQKERMTKMLRAEMQLIYIGSSFNASKRLSEHFGGGYGPCRILEPGWRTRPAFVATIVTRSFEASSLEEYLVEVLDHPLLENVHGRRRGA